MNWPKYLGTKLLLLTLILWGAAYYGTIWYTQRHPRQAIVWLHDKPKMQGGSARAGMAIGFYVPKRPKCASKITS